MGKLAKWMGVILFCLSAFQLNVFAASDRIKDIPSVRISISTKDLELGDELTDDAESYVSCPENEYYYLEDAEWMDNVNSLAVGDEPRIKVYLSAKPREIEGDRYNTVYLFRGSYTSSNVRITNGTFLSAARRDSGYTLEVTLRIKPVKGQYEPPEDVRWTGSRGTARWDRADNDSGYYDLICYRNSTIVKKLNSYHGNSYNFYPYMTKAGDYSFKVRSVAPENVSNAVGQNSDWAESDSTYIGDHEVSDGSGQTNDDVNGAGNSGSGNLYPNGTGNANVAGWVKEDGYTYFRYPNGESVKDGWLKLGDKYYMFDKQGRMLTGWQLNKYGIWFYMDPGTGEMKTGWLNDQGQWYFLNTTKDDYEGCLVRGWWNYDGKRYYFNESGVMVTGWYQIDGLWHYFYPEGSTDGAYGYLAANTQIGAFYVDGDGVWRQ